MGWNYVPEAEETILNLFKSIINLLDFLFEIHGAAEIFGLNT